MSDRSTDPTGLQATASHAAVAPTRPSGTDETAVDSKRMPSGEKSTPLASQMRKAQVRAALFQKLDPVRIGRFTLLEPLGAGAMGEIYAAYDEQLDRKVALKLVRGSFETTAKADHRLLREAQTLAQVSHPNVVQIYEAGTYNGRLFIAMELIRGKSLSTWLRDSTQVPRAVRQREILRHFIAAGRGLEAAHKAGVAHRDFKPDNVLVGDDGRVRVVDFGLARALGDATDSARTTTVARTAPAARIPDELLPDTADGAAIAGEEPSAGSAAGGQRGPIDSLAMGGSTIDLAPAGSAVHETETGVPPRLKAAVQLTETGAVVGTPSFMAPEQMRGALADRRSDQFSFCVSLYHALYDTFPFSGKSMRELRDSIATDKVAFTPGIQVPAFVRRAIARGLSVEPAQRFPDMGALLAALQPRRRRRRVWIAATATALVAAAAIAWTAGVTANPCAAAGADLDAAWSPARQTAIQAAFSRSELSFAATAWAGLRPRADAYVTTLRDGAVAACKATHVARTQSAELLDRRMACLERGRRRLDALGAELETATRDAIEHAVEGADGLPDIAGCNDAEALMLGAALPAANARTKVAAIRDRLARAKTIELLGRYEDALTIARAAAADTEALGYPPVRAEALMQVARGLHGRDTADARAESERLYFDALDLAEAARHDPLVTEIWQDLVWLAVSRDPNTERARAWLRRGTAAARRISHSARDQAELHHLTAEVFYREGKYAEAASSERQAIEIVARAPSPQLALSRYKGALARSLDNLGQLDEARRLHEEALAIASETYGASHLVAIRLQINQGRSLARQGQLDRARATLEDALHKVSSNGRDATPDAARIHGFLSELGYRRNDLANATEHARASLDIYQRALPGNHALLAEAYSNLGNIQVKRREFRAALVGYNQALTLRRRAFPNGSYATAINEANIAETLIELAQLDDAAQHLAEAERMASSGSGYQRETEAWMLVLRGELLVGKQRARDAVPALERALVLLGEGNPDPCNLALALWTLARALRALDSNPARVHALAERAMELFAQQGEWGAPPRDAVARFLGRSARSARSSGSVAPRPASPR